MPGTKRARTDAPTAPAASETPHFKFTGTPPRGAKAHPGPPTARTVYEPVCGWAKLPHGLFLREATSVAVDEDDRVYVFNRGNMPVLVFSPDGNLIHCWGNPDPFTGTAPLGADMYGGHCNHWPLSRFVWPHSVRVDHEGNLWLTDVLDHRVFKMTKDGQELMRLGTGEPGQRAGPQHVAPPFNRPTDVAVDPATGDVYVSDGYRNSRVHRFDKHGKLQHSFGEPGADAGQFSLPHNVALLRRAGARGAGDGGGGTGDLELIVCDRENHRVCVHAAQDGAFRREWHVHKATAVCVGRGTDDAVYIGEQGPPPVSNGLPNLGHRVGIWTADGKLVNRIGAPLPGERPGAFLWPHSVAVDSRGDIYVAEVSYAEVGRAQNPPREMVSLKKWRRASG
eukprot:g4821.t1